MQQKKIVKGIIVTCFLGGLIPVALYFMATSLNHTKNGFDRTFSGVELIPVGRSADIVNPYRLAESNGTIAVSLMEPGSFKTFNTSLEQIGVHEAGYKFTNRRHTSYQMIIDSPTVYLLIGNNRKIYKLNLSSGQVYDSIAVPYLFLRSTVWGNDHFAFRCFDTSRSHPLIYISLNANYKTRMNYDAVQRKDEPGHAMEDGLLNYSSNTHQFVFTEFFSGAIHLLDTNLRSDWTIHTVDTISENMTKSGFVQTGQGKDVFTSLSPRYQVNNLSTVSRDSIFVESMIKGDNQTNRDFMDNYTIDVYSIKDRKYLCSFYIPKRKHKYLLDFKVVGNAVYVLYTDHLESFRLRA
ncbi:hypothetical protein [Dinghuibacter silviterrae]|nr:hypothetical protein [Dinghuibacter silviterrae]